MRHSLCFVAATLVAACVAAEAGADLVGSDITLSNDSRFLSINTGSGAATLVGIDMGSVAPDVRGLAYDRNTDTFYGVDQIKDNLVKINRMTGAATTVGSLVNSQVPRGLAFDPNANKLYLTDTAADLLFTVNTTTGEATQFINDLGFDKVNGLAFDANTNTLYGSDTTSNQLITISTATGEGTAVGSLEFDVVVGLAFDANSNTLYGSDIDTDQLITIDTATGEGTAVGSLGFQNVEGLAFAVPEPSSFVLAGVVGMLFPVGYACKRWGLLRHPTQPGR